MGAAYRTLVDVGYNQVSMRKIADEAGVNQSLLHYHFGSKEQLMVEVLGYVNDELLARQRKMYAEAGTFEAIWEQALEYFREDIRSGYVRAMWELWAQGLSNPRIRKRWVETAQRWRDLVTDLARKALRDYGITRGYDAAVVGHIIADLYYGAEVNILSFADPEGHVEAIRMMGNLFRWLAQDAKKRSTGEAVSGGPLAGTGEPFVRGARGDARGLRHRGGDAWTRSS